jgi:hypothetical protein
MRPLAGLFATLVKTKRSTWARHTNDFRSNAPAPTAHEKTTMNGKFESTSKNYDESKLNGLPCQADELIDSIPRLQDWRRERAGSGGHPTTPALGRGHSFTGAVRPSQPGRDCE